MAMNWPDERYVRVYTRDTADWLCLSFLAQGFLCLLFRKVDRAGVLDLGKAGRKGAAIAIGHAHQWPLLEPALEELLADGCVEIHGDRLVIPNFMEAQEAESSDKARSRKYREKRRALARSGGVTESTPDAEPVTPAPRAVTLPSRERDATVSCDAPVTKHVATVTPNCAVPSVPSEPINYAHTQTPREQGAADRLTILAPRPLTAELIAELERRGFECGPPAKAPSAREVEKAVSAVGVTVAAGRVMAIVERDRALSVVPHSTLGWYLDAICGRPEGGTRPRNHQQSNPQVGVAVPADASAFGEGGQRAIE